MRPNPTLKRLGFADTDRVAIIHVDDVGMCHASVEAFADLAEAGRISSAALMSAAPWFPSAAAYCRERPHVDVGVHLTLTSEWAAYRWRPVSAAALSSGIVDRHGYFFPSVQRLWAHATVNAVEDELQAQIDAAVAAGVVPTHLDTHMFALFHPKLLPSYISVAVKNGLPPLAVRLDQAGWVAHGLQPEAAKATAAMMWRLEESGFPMVDRLAKIVVRPGEPPSAAARRALDALKPGITHLIIHPAKDSAELRGMTPLWGKRVNEYQAFMDAAVLDFAEKQGVQLMGYAAFRAALPRSS